MNVKRERSMGWPPFAGAIGEEMGGRVAGGVGICNFRFAIGAGCFGFVSSKLIRGEEGWVVGSEGMEGDFGSRGGGSVGSIGRVGCGWFVVCGGGVEGEGSTGRERFLRPAGAEDWASCTMGLRPWLSSDAPLGLGEIGLELDRAS